MMPPNRTRGVLLLALSAVLSCTIAAEWVTRPRDLPPALVSTMAAAAGDPGQLRGRPDADVLVRQLRERPLFAPNRRPVVEASGGVPGVPRLTGIILDGARRIALFAGPDGSGSRAAEAGQDVGSYSVVAVASDAVTVTGPEGAQVLRPAFAKYVPKVEAPLPPGPPALLQLEAGRPH